jgi:hypothetical protein
MPNDDFFNLIIKSQRTRLEDQRSSIAAPPPPPPLSKPTISTSSTSSSSSSSAIISSSSSNSINTHHHHQTNTHFQAHHIIASTASSSSSSSLTNTIKQLDPINNKAETLTMAPTKTCLSSSSSSRSGANKNNQAITVPPDDEFFSMIQKIQSRRLDEQRTSIRPSMFGNGENGNNLRKMPMATETTNTMAASTRPSQLLH